MIRYFNITSRIIILFRSLVKLTVLRCRITLRGVFVSNTFILKFLGIGEAFSDAPHYSKLKNWVKSEWIQYEIWLYYHSFISDKDWYGLRNKSLSFKHRLLISILTPTYNTKTEYLKECVYSVITQSYPFWEMCIVDDGSTNKDTIQYLNKISKLDSRIKLIKSKKNRGICDATNRALKIAQGEYIGFLDHDDRISPEALYYVVKEIQNNSNIDIFYSDRDMISPNGKRFMHLFKPDWAPETLFSTNYTCHFTVYQHKLLQKIGGIHAEYEGSQDHDLILRAAECNPKVHHINKVFYHWRQHENSLAFNHDAKEYAYDAAVRAIEQSLKRRGLEGDVAEIPNLWRGNYRVKLKPPSAKAYRIIPLERDADQENYADMLLKNIDQYINSDIEFLIFLDPNLTYDNNNTLGELVSWFQIPEVAFVTGKIVDLQQRILHAGLVHKPDGMPLSVYSGCDEKTAGYMASTSILRNVSSPHPACFAVRCHYLKKLLKLESNYLNYRGVHIIFDMALKALQSGYRIIYTPFARFKSGNGLIDINKAVENDRVLFKKNWTSFLNKGDPYYNKWLSLKKVDMSLDSDF